MGSVHHSLSSHLTFLPCQRWGRFTTVDNGRITNTAPNLDSIEAYGGNSARYAYDEENGRLTSITDITGRTVGITYTYAGGAWRIATLKPAGSNYLENPGTVGLLKKVHKK